MTSNGSIIRHRELLPAALLGLALFFSPLPFGSVSAAYGAALQAVGFATLACVLALGGRPTRDAGLPALLLAVVAAWGLAQAVSLPSGLLETVAPWQAERATQARELIAPPEGVGSSGGGELSTSAPPAVRSTISVAPGVSRWVAWNWLGAAAAFLAAAGLGRGARRVLAGGLVAGLLFQIAYGLPRWFAGTSTIWGREVPGDIGRFRGTFVNPNHLATFLAIGLSVCVAWGWWGLRRSRYESSWVRRIALLAPPVGVGATVLTGLALSGSRAGLLAALAGVSIQGGMLWWAGRRSRAERRREFRRGPTLVTAGLLAVLLAASLVTFRTDLARWLDLGRFDVSLSERATAYQAAFDLWTRAPIVGTGLGTFREAFPATQPPGVPWEWWHAHSDPLELLITLGLPITLALVVGVILVGLRLARSFTPRFPAGGRRRSEDRAVALAGCGALVAVSAQEWVDFGLSMPANYLALAVLCGAGLAAGRRTGLARARGSEGEVRGEG